MQTKKDKWTNWAEARERGDGLMTHKALGIHDKGVEAIVNRLNKQNVYDQIYNHLEYHNQYTRDDGEIDCLARRVDTNHRKDIWHIFEYKCNNIGKRKKKAIQQLNRAEIYISCEFPTATIYKWYVSGKDMKYERIK